MTNYALGLIETKSFASAIAITDYVLKNYAVSLFWRKTIPGGYSTVAFTGKLGAIGDAIIAGAELANKDGDLLATKIIAKPDGNLLNYFEGDDNE